MQRNHYIQSLGIACVTGVTMSFTSYLFGSSSSPSAPPTATATPPVAATPPPVAPKPIVTKRAVATATPTAGAGAVSSPEQQPQTVVVPSIEAIRALHGGESATTSVAELKQTRRDRSIIRGPYLDDAKMPEHPIWRLALSGGPCGGKSSAMKIIKSHFEPKGYEVYTVPEVATILIKAGLDVPKMVATDEGSIETQKLILQNIISLEDTFYRIALYAKKPALIICDRGTMDGRAYCSPQQWNKVMERTGYSLDELRDVRYDAVIHLVTAAIGAEKHYTLENNAARSEGLDQAREADERTKRQWVGHKRIHVVDNSTDFQAKMGKVTTFIENLVDTSKKFTSLEVWPVSTERPLTFPAEQTDAERHVVNVSTFNLIPRPAYKQEQLVKRSSDQSDTYFLRVKLRTNQFQHVPVSARDFSYMLREREDTRYGGPESKRHEFFFYGGPDGAHNLYYWCLTSWFSGPEAFKGKTFLIGQRGVDPTTELPFLSHLLGDKTPHLTDKQREVAPHNFQLKTSSDGGAGGGGAGGGGAASSSTASASAAAAASGEQPSHTPE